MHRWLIAWRIAGAGAVLGLCTVLVSTHLIASFAGHHQAGAACAPIQASPSVWTSGIVAQTQTAGPDTIALTATPDPFGTYTFIVAVRDVANAPLQGAAVDLMLTMPDMQMAALRIHVPPMAPPVPGVYHAEGVLAAGRWQAVVQVLAQPATHPVQAIFRFLVA